MYSTMDLQIKQKKQLDDAKENRLSKSVFAFEFELDLCFVYMQIAIDLLFWIPILLTRIPFLL